MVAGVAVVKWRLDWCFLFSFHFSRTLHFLLTFFLLLSQLQSAVSFSPLPPAMFLWCCYFCPSRFHTPSLQFSSQFSWVQSLSCVQLFATPWIAAHQASLSITNSRSSLKLTSNKSVLPFSHFILCRPPFLLPPIPPSITVFSNE